MLGPLFFPSSDPVVSLLATFAVFGVGFGLRPLGGLFFGHLGDRYGRRNTLVLINGLKAPVSMGLVTTIVGLAVFTALVPPFARGPQPARARTPSTTPAELRHSYGRVAGAHQVETDEGTE